MIRWYEHYAGTQNGRERIQAVRKTLQLANPLLVEDTMTGRDKAHPFERMLQRLDDNPRDRVIRMERVVLEGAFAEYEKALQAIEGLENAQRETLNRLADAQKVASEAGDEVSGD